jgi:hypothetical protein
MWAEGVGKGEGDENQRVGQLLPGKGPEWMGIRLPSKLGFFFFTRSSVDG